MYICFKEVSHEQYSRMIGYIEKNWTHNRFGEHQRTFSVDEIGKVEGNPPSYKDVKVLVNCDEDEKILHEVNKALKGLVEIVLIGKIDRKNSK